MLGLELDVRCATLIVRVWGIKSWPQTGATHWSCNQRVGCLLCSMATARIHETGLGQAQGAWSCPLWSGWLLSSSTETPRRHISHTSFSKAAIYDLGYCYCLTDRSPYIVRLYFLLKIYNKYYFLSVLDYD